LRAAFSTVAGVGARETKKRQPPIRLPDRLLAHLRRRHQLGLSRSAIVEFDGAPVARVSKGFRHAAADAGLNGVTPHTLRHTAATWAMQGSADLWEAAGYLGMTAQMLEERYGQLRPDHGAGVEKALTRR
jgi:integrase